MPNKTLTAFTEGTTLAPTDFLVGYNSGLPTGLVGSERKWNASLLGEYVKQALGVQPWQATAWVTFDGLVNVNANAVVKSSYNVASVLRIADATGCNTVVSRFQIRFAQPMSNSNYTVIGMPMVGDTTSIHHNDQALGVYSKATNTATDSVVSVFDMNNRGTNAQVSRFTTVVFFGGK